MPRWLEISLIVGGLVLFIGLGIGLVVLNARERAACEGRGGVWRHEICFNPKMLR